MSQPTQTSSVFPTVPVVKAGKEGAKASPSLGPPVARMTIATEGEGGIAYYHKMMAQGGPAGTGESELQGLTPFLQLLIYTNSLNSSFTCNQYPPRPYFAKTPISCQ